MIGGQFANDAESHRQGGQQMSVSGLDDFTVPRAERLKAQAEALRAQILDLLGKLACTEGGNFCQEHSLKCSGTSSYARDI